MGIKAGIPKRLKYPFWYLFKSPSRRYGILKTLSQELLSHGYLSAKSLGKKKLEPVTICTGLKNRSDNYINYLLQSILRADNQDLISLSIFDCGSEDVKDLEARIREVWNGSLTFQSSEIPFARAYSFNRAVDGAQTPIIFLADADMSMPKDIVRQCNKWVSSRSAWFPICFNLKEGSPPKVSPENGAWWPVGLGMVACRRKDYLQLGGLDEAFQSWGGEDWDFWLRCWENGLTPVRTKAYGFFHHWHPSLRTSLSQ